MPGQAADYAERLDPPDVYVELITAEGVHDLRGQPRRGHPGSPEPAGEFGVHPWRQDIEYLDFVPQFGARRERARVQTDERYELMIGGEPFTAVVKRGRLEVRSGQPDSPTASLHADPAGLLDIRTGRIDVGAAIDKGLLRFDGPDVSVRRLRRAFAL